MAEENGLNSGNRSRASSPSKVPTRPTTPARNLRASVGSNLVRNSAEKSDSPESSKKSAVPNYLRASTGSCHDFCKYGREHSFEKKEKKLVRKKIPNQQPFVETLLSDKQKKEKPSTDIKNHSPDQTPSRDSKSCSPKPTPSRNSKSYSPKPVASLDKGKAVKHKPSKDVKNHSPDTPPSVKSDAKILSDVKTCSVKENGSSGNKTPLAKMLSDVKTGSIKENGSSGNKTPLSKKPSSTKKITPAASLEIVKGVIVPSTEVEDSAKRATSTDKKLSKKAYVSQPRSSPVKPKTLNVKPSAYSENSDGKGIRNGSSEMGKNLTVSKTPVKKVPVSPVAILSPKFSVNKIARNNSRKAGTLKLVSSVKVQNKPQKVVKTEESNDEKFSEKTLHVIETETKNDVSESNSKQPSLSSEESLSSADSSSLSHENEVKTPPVKENHNNSTQPSLSSEESLSSADSPPLSSHEDEVKTPPVKENHSNSTQLSLSLEESLSSADSPPLSSHEDEVKTSPVKENHNNLTQPSLSSEESLSSADSSSLSSHEDEVKTPPVKENHNSSTQSLSSEAEESLSSADSLSLSSHEDEVKTPPATVKENHNKIVRKSRAVVSEDKCSNPVKLKFRSGKVVDVQTDNNSPRRLRFRRARVLGGQDSKGETRKALKKAGAKKEAIGAEVSSEKVVLKHQDVQDKKDAQGLLNNVIEETASKLVESRKSKVKALVGAFETVISLQETKPSSQVS